MKAWLTVALLALMLSNCGQAAEDFQEGFDAGRSGSPEPSTSRRASEQTPEPPEPAQVATASRACDSAFARAADVDEFRDTVSDLYPAAMECSNLDDWKLGASANPGAIAEGVDPVLFAYNMCTDAPAEVRSGTVCKESIEADPMGIEKLTG
jgi:hypothetical protein